MVDSIMKQSSNRLTEIICTLREGGADDVEGDVDLPAQRSKYGPITLTYQGMHVTLRPWDPYNCILAAAIHNRLLHFPIWPGSCVFALGCSLYTLGHIVDVLGNGGRLIGVIGEGQSQQPPPTSDELRKFLKRHPGASIVTENVQNASFERYQRLLSLPEASRYAFLMALHPRLGVNSPARKLIAAPAKLVRRIFSFLVCHDAADVNSLVVCHWPLGTQVDVIRNVVLSHIDIFSHWRRTIYNQPCAQRHEEGTLSSWKRSDDDRESVPQWVLLDIPIDHISTNNSSQEAEDMDTKLIEVIGAMKRLTNGLRTGLQAKEQLLLEPYFPKHVFLSLKYAAHRDERCGKVRTSRRQAAQELAEKRGGGGSSAPVVSTSASVTAAPLDDGVCSQRAPSGAAVPVLPFHSSGGSAASNAPSPSGSGPAQSTKTSGPVRPNTVVAATRARGGPRARAAAEAAAPAAAVAAPAAVNAQWPLLGPAEPRPHEPPVEYQAAGTGAVSGGRSDAKAVTWAEPAQISHEPQAVAQGGNMMMWMQQQGGCGSGPLMPQDPFSNGNAGLRPVEDRGPQQLRPSAGSMPPPTSLWDGNNSFGPLTQVPKAPGQAPRWQPPAYLPHSKAGGNGRGGKGNFAQGHKNLQGVKHHAPP